MYTTADFRNGLKIEYEGEPYVIVGFQHVRPGKGAAFVRTKIKSLLSGRTIEPTLRSGDKVGTPDLDEKDMEYLYREGDAYVFMDTTNYEQVNISQEAVGDSSQWLKENTPVTVLWYKGRPITLTLPNFIELKVVYCEPGMKGDTATGASKPAKLETGASIQVPLFVKEGDLLRIDTRTGTYVDRV